MILEIRTDVFNDEESPVRQVEEIRGEINKILPPGIALKFVPVSEYRYEFIPSTDEKGARAKSLLKIFGGGEEEGLERLYASAINSLQVNDSTVFRGRDETEEAALETARKVHNLFSGRVPQLLEMNSDQKDFYGRNRIESYNFLMQRVKGERFLKAGYTLDQITVPPNFADLDSMKKYLCTHCGVDSFDRTRSKEEHAMTVKIKRPDRVRGEANGFYAAETRIFDAVDSPEAIRERIKLNSRLLKII